MVRQPALFDTLASAVRQAFPQGTTLKHPAYPDALYLQVRTPDGARFTVSLDGGPRGYSVSVAPDRFAGRFAAARLEGVPDNERLTQALKELYASQAECVHE